MAAAFCYFDMIGVNLKITIKFVKQEGIACGVTGLVTYQYENSKFWHESLRNPMGLFTENVPIIVKLLTS